MGSEVLEEMEFQPMFDEVKRSLGGKSAALFLAPTAGARRRVDARLGKRI